MIETSTSPASPARCLWPIFVLACTWGTVEAAGGIALRTCAVSYSGSILTGVSIFFFASSSVLAGRLRTIWLLPVIAGLFRVYGGVLVGHSPLGGTILNPVFAYFAIAAAFFVVMLLARPGTKDSLWVGALAGAMTAVAAIVLFLPAGWVTGSPVCRASDGMPLAIRGLPVAVSIAAFAAPLGFRVGHALQRLVLTPDARRRPVVAPASLAVTVACLAIVTFLHVR